MVAAALIEWFWAHPNTPLWGALMVTAVLKFLYGSGFIFPLKESRKGGAEQPVKLDFENVPLSSSGTFCAFLFGRGIMRRPVPYQSLIK